MDGGREYVVGLGVFLLGHVAVPLFFHALRLRDQLIESRRGQDFVPGIALVLRGRFVVVGLVSAGDIVVANVSDVPRHIGRGGIGRVGERQWRGARRCLKIYFALRPCH